MQANNLDGFDSPGSRDRGDRRRWRGRPRWDPWGLCVNVRPSRLEPLIGERSLGYVIGGLQDPSERLSIGCVWAN
jgi:hypothetical protein